MPFEDMLNHRCDVYHIQKTDTSPGYGLPSSPSFSYPDTPDISGLSCHFSVKSGVTVGLNIVQREPYATLEGRVKLTLSLGSDIRINDKIVNLETGYEYTAEAPTQIRDHHLVVMLRRTDEQEKI